MTARELIDTLEAAIACDFTREVKIGVWLGGQAALLEIEEVKRVNDNTKTGAVLCADLAGHVTVKLEAA